MSVPKNWGWYIWLTYYDQNGHITGYGRHPFMYKSKHSAECCAARKFGRRCDKDPLVTWTIAQSNPFKEVI